ncbi:MAG TPA: GAF domain-containing protein [Planctomycetota bacterium]|jgi:PAS domain-containing protein|nr:GAF domain-containing protein [Planctomycetota bacterium]
MTGQRGDGMLRHKRILISIRFVFLILITSIALPAFVQGKVTVVLPIILAAYLLTNLAMIPEQRQAFFKQRIQACLLIFDILVLVLSMYYLDEYRQELFLAMFLVVLLASAGQRVSVSIGGFVAIAAFYIWFNLNQSSGPDPITLRRLTTGLPVLLVVAIYVGYVSEAVAREHRDRQEAEDRLTKELRGMNRFQTLASNVMAEVDPGRLFFAIAEAAREFLGCPYAAVFWVMPQGTRFETALSNSFPESLAARWKASEPDASPVGKAFKAGKVLRFTSMSGEAWLSDPEAGIEEVLVAPFSDRAGGLQGSLVIVWSKPHVHVAAEEEASEVMTQQASLLLENASLYQMLAQTRDIWQAAFQSIPTPVVIVDGKSRIVQANPSFLALGDFDFATLMGSSFDDVLEGAAYPNGTPINQGGIAPAQFDAARLTIPKLNGEFDVTRGPYVGSNQAGTGMVWVLRKVESDAVAGKATSSG